MPIAHDIASKAAVAGAHLGASDTTSATVATLNVFDTPRVLADPALVPAPYHGLVGRLRGRYARYHGDGLKRSAVEKAVALLALNCGNACQVALCAPHSGFLGRCKQWHVCSHCANIRNYRFRQRFGPAFHNGCFFWTTWSLGEALPGTSAVWAMVPKYWAAWKAVLDAGLSVRHPRRRLIRGYVAVQELALSSLLPLKMRPHVHAIIEADHVDESVLAEMVERLPKDAMASIGAQATTKVAKIPSAELLFEKIRYAIKPIDLATRYQGAWLSSVNSPADATQLNSEVSTFLSRYHATIFGRPQIHSRGSMREQGAAYIGVRRKDFPRFKAEVDRLSLCRRAAKVASE